MKINIVNPDLLKKKIFISHSNKDRKIASKLVDEVICKVLNIDKEKDIFFTSDFVTGIKPSQDWLDTIKEALRNSSIFIPIITPNFKASEMCLNEIGAAWISDKNTFSIILPPLTIDHLGPTVNRLQANKLQSTLEIKQFINAFTEQAMISCGLTMKENIDIDKISLSFLKSLKNLIARNLFSYKDDSILKCDGIMYLYQNKKLSEIPDKETLLLLGLKKIKICEISNSELTRFNFDLPYLSVKTAPVFNVQGYKEYWMIFNHERKQIPDYETQQYLSQYNDLAKRPSQVSKTYLENFRPSPSLKSIKDYPELNTGFNTVPTGVYAIR